MCLPAFSTVFWAVCLNAFWGCFSEFYSRRLFAVIFISGLAAMC